MLTPLLLERADRTAYIYEDRLPVAERKRFPIVTAISYTLYTLWWRCYIERYNPRWFGAQRWWLQTQTLHSKLQPNRCRQRHGYYWQPIGTSHQPIQRHHRRPPTTYRLAAIHALQTTDGQTDRQTDISYPMLDLTVGQKLSESQTTAEVTLPHRFSQSAVEYVKRNVSTA